jgi:hypothetical protein
MSLLATLDWQRQKAELREIIREELAAAESPTRWVSNAAYCKYHGICPATLWKLQEALKMNKAMRGSGRAARYDKFFNPAHYMGKRKNNRPNGQGEQNG